MSTSEPPDDLKSRLNRRRFHVVTARFNKNVDLTNTRVTAVYRWTSGFSASTLDPYQSSVEFNEPSLSFTLAQALPTWKTFPGKVQAVLDARNVLEQSLGSGRTQMSRSPRFFKGGISVHF